MIKKILAKYYINGKWVVKFFKYMLKYIYFLNNALIHSSTGFFLILLMKAIINLTSYEFKSLF